ncbi:MAG: ABC transporter, ATP-binding protein 1 (cluster 4, leucine/isoleucine/valine/benzoate) [uncultured Microvirga sp.]|uniref:ABC transporter, ATP-binding protein 1 (Cluster 4, leucine/isoleucine/valine/benzoate) n=1 Tax=uncultured Microvirga sp. TaxID=412392 RepID=A0A6J4M8W7_9HYPH|nr:MAG: ABC transporter, ATP-binding protein 1 (cluster 4, leucine/isoleucine/valine/benzoate) [uncultured Microvirga sp.]
MLSVHGLQASYGPSHVLFDVELQIGEGQVVTLLGRNGMGKTTVVSQLMGNLAPDAGEIRLRGEDISGLPTADRVARGVARTFQITQLLLEYTALDNVALAVQARLGHSFRFWADARRDEELRAPARRYLAQVGLQHRSEIRVADLSHGEHKQLELAVALATEPRLLLLDEPMAGLGAAESRQMVEALLGLKGRLTTLLIEHDMDAVFALADRVSVLVYGRLIASGTGPEIQADERVRVAYLGEGDA